MPIGLGFAVLVVACGLAVARAARAPLSLAPVSGLASVAVLSVWCRALGMPPLVGTGLMVFLAFVGLVTSLRSARVTSASIYACRWPLLVLAAAVALPGVLLASTLAGVDAPVSTHDGAFHVETIDSLRQGVAVQMWYPVGFHTSVAAVLGLVPWLDTARGTVEIALGLAMLAPLGLYGVGRSLGLLPLQASVGAVVLALTFVFPYDDHLWGGWPLAMSIVLLLGLWAVAALWIAQPRVSLAGIGGLLAGAIVLTHGTEAYSGLLGLAIIAAARWRGVQGGRLARHLPLAGVCALVCALPYLTTLLGWAGGGGASSAGVLSLDAIDAHPEVDAGGDWLEFVLGITGASSLVDLPLRAILLGIGARGRHMRLVVALWAAFSAALFGVSFLDVGPVRWVYVVTFPWLIHHRPPQLVVLFASLLIASGLATLVAGLWSWRPRLAPRRHTWRRLAIAGGVLLAFFAEGSTISIYKTLEEVIVAQNGYLPEDRAAMAWLGQHAQPGELVVNDQFADAGIWAPYKAGVPILLPRSAAALLSAQRLPVLTHLLELNTTPDASAEACGLHVGYVYSGARQVPGLEHLLPSRAALETDPSLEKVFSSGQAAIFRIHLAC